MNWRDERVLVTGAGGFIGSHLVERLVDVGARVRAFVHYNALGSSGWLDESPAIRDVEIFSGDICDRDCVSDAMEGQSVVFHLAALIAIPYSYRAPESYARTNIEGTLNVLRAAQRGGVRRVVHTSTSEVYGTARYAPIDESHPLQGQSPYSASKIGADKFVEAFHASFALPVVTVRPFNTFGPRQSARAVVPTIIGQALAGGPIRLGNTYPTRDLNFVANQVDGFLRAAANDAAIGQTFNLGSGREISVADLVALIGKALNEKLEVRHEQERDRPPESEVGRLVADSTLAQSVLGWSPMITLESGLEQTIAWMRRHASKYPSGAYVI